MGWFWADSYVNLDTRRSSQNEPPRDINLTPPPECPMHRSNSNEIVTGPLVSPLSTSRSVNNAGTKYSVYNPLNYIFSDLSQEPATHQSVVLPIERENSTIPKGAGKGNWEYPSPQQMYNALLRKGYTDTDVTAVESMVSVHNYLNEGAWAEIVEWEQTFGMGLKKGWEICKNGGKRGNVFADDDNEEKQPQPSLLSFMGRPNDMTPKAAMFQLLGKISPTRFGTNPPFDRHDWLVQRKYKDHSRNVRYIIDYYEGPDDPNGESVFFLDVRPALTPLTAIERMMYWVGHTWYKASGGAATQENST